MIKISSKKEGFRRAGMAHTKESKEYSDDFFNAEQLAALKAEPMLDVTVISSDTADPSTMTVEQLKADLAIFVGTDALKGLKKPELVAMWASTRNDLKALAG
jgi:hypothetical protein